MVWRSLGLQSTARRAQRGAAVRAGTGGRRLSALTGALIALLAAGLAALALGGCAEPKGDATLTRAPLPAGPRLAIRPIVVAAGLENPWSLAFLPEGGFLVTERPGRLLMVNADGRLSAPIAGVPAVAATGQGGLLDIALYPHFSENRLIYLSFAEPDGTRNRTAVLRARLSPAFDRLSEVKIIFRQRSSVDSAQHFGSRLAFAPDGTLFITLGERYSERDQAQKLDNTLGKIVRLRDDGSIPDDNPFAKGGGLPEIWSYGHRNVQGAAIIPATGQLWTHEHGPKGGDEINIARAGRNYGWPVITYGVDYSGLPIGIGSARPGLEQPIYYWRPSIAPSGMAFYTGDKYPGWTGDLFVGALAGRRLAHLDIEGDRIVGEEPLLGEIGQRIRDVRQGPDGFLYVLTDEADGALIRLELAPSRP